MPLDFPSSPTNGQAYQGYVYNAANETWDSAYAPRAATVPITSPNAIINGAFDIWQRGTSFTTSAAVAYTADRWQSNVGTGGTVVVSQQAFTPGTAPSADREGTFFCRVNRTVTGSAPSYFVQRIEDVRSFAGRTVTVSFWAKASANYSLDAGYVYLLQHFGSGGSTAVGFSVNSAATITTSWQRFSYTVSVPSISGKTIGSNSFLELTFAFPTATGTFSIDLWGVQVEDGAAATEFRRNAPSVAGELAACQRYYWRSIAGSASLSAVHGIGLSLSNNLAMVPVVFPVTMRVTPTSVEWSQLQISDWFNYSLTLTSLNIDVITVNVGTVACYHTAGSTVNKLGYLRNNNTIAGFIAFSSEL